MSDNTGTIVSRRDVSGAKVLKTYADMSRLLTEAGLDAALVQRANDDEIFRQRLLEFWQELTLDQKLPNYVRDLPKDCSKVSQGCAADFVHLMVEIGFNRAQARLVIDSKQARELLVRFWRDDAWPGYVSQEEAKEIMGDNMLSTEEVERHLGIKFDKNQLKALERIPFSRAVLKNRGPTVFDKNSILLPGFLMTVLEIAERTKAQNQENHDSQKDSEFNFLCKSEVSLCWYLINKDIPHRSTDKTRDEQTAYIRSQDNLQIPRACEIAYMISVLSLVRGERTLIARSISGGGDRTTRCLGEPNDQYQGIEHYSCIGGFGSDGFYVYHETSTNHKSWSTGMMNMQKDSWQAEK